MLPAQGSIFGQGRRVRSAWLLTQTGHSAKGSAEREVALPGPTLPALCVQAVLEQAVGDLRQRVAQQAQRLGDGLQCWERVRGELQQENAGLAAALAQRTAEYQDLMEEKEVGGGAALPSALPGCAAPAPTGWWSGMCCAAAGHLVLSHGW